MIDGVDTYVQCQYDVVSIMSDIRILNKIPPKCRIPLEFPKNCQSVTAASVLATSIYIDKLISFCHLSLLRILGPRLEGGRVKNIYFSV